LTGKEKCYAHLVILVYRIGATRFQKKRGREKRMKTGLTPRRT
jgi:hypothetical protein